MTTNSTAEILNKAADVIEERGWHQGGFAPLGTPTDLKTCPVCVLAAINVAAGRRPDEDFGMDDDRREAAFALAAHLGIDGELDDYVEEGVENVIGNDWNDHVAESAEQVITALRETAKAAEVAR